MKFRTDINAIRTLAVVSVVIFHFVPQWLPGGFVGVDIFFVISGYLMTRIILEGLKNQSFSLINFYNSRLNRIAPALAILCLTLLILGALYFAPHALDTLARHTSYAASFASNITFHNEAGYFDSTSKEKWLLHTWSLSVEWQFYLIYPLMLAVLSRITPYKFTFYIINALLVASLIWCLYIGHSSEESPYFLLQTRAWEMLLGSWAFFYRPKNSLPALPGWLLLGLSVFFLNPDIIWPGIWTLVPTLGTVWILCANKSGSISKFSLIQKIGLYSYSIYLWHWPIAVLIYKLGKIDIIWIILGIFLSFLLGAISYHTIEQISFPKKISSIQQLVLSKPLWLLLTVALVAKFIHQQEGLPQRGTLNNEVVSLYERIKKVNGSQRKQCHFNPKNQFHTPCHLMSDKPNWATLGDSHSVELSDSLANQLNHYGEGVQQNTFSGCKPSFQQDEHFSSCAVWTNRSVKAINDDENIQYVVILYRYSDHLFGANEKTYPHLPNEYSDAYRQTILTALDNTIDSFINHGKEVFIIMPIPEMGRSIQSLIDQNYFMGKPLDNIPSVSLNYYQARNQIIKQHLEQYRHRNGIHLISTQDIFCQQQQCFAVKNGQPLYFDDDHPSLIATDIIAKRIIDYIDK